MKTSMRGLQASCIGALILGITAVYSEQTALSSGKLVQHEAFRGARRWELVPYLWSDKTLNITCPFAEDFAVYVAPDLQTLSDKVDRKESIWCGWHNFIGLTTGSCVARISPFGTVHLAVIPSIPGRQCTVRLEQRVSPFMIAQTITGALLFLNASTLSASLYFRLSTGSVGVMLLSVLILIFVLARMLPNKKSAAALVAVFGSSFTGFIRFFFGQWIPSFEQLIFSKVFLAYLAISGLAGLALTYYYDSEENVKLHNILKYGLKLLGLVLVVFGSSLPEASLALCCLLLASQLLPPTKLVWRKGSSAKEAFRALVAESPIGGVVRSPQWPVQSEHGVKEEPEFEQETEDPDAAGPRPPSSQETAASRAIFQAAQTPFPGFGQAARARLTPEGAAAESSCRDRTEATPPRVQPPDRERQQDSPLIQRGLVLNLDTGRTVKIDGPTYNKMVLQGYEVDRVAGTLTPPPRGSPASRSPGPASAAKVRSRRSAS